MGKPCVVWRPRLWSSWDLRPVRSRSHHHVASGCSHVALCNHRLWEEVEQGLRKCVEWVSAEAQCPALPHWGVQWGAPSGSGSEAGPEQWLGPSRSPGPVRGSLREGWAPPRAVPGSAPPSDPQTGQMTPHFPVLLIPSDRSQGVKINAWRESEATPAPSCSLYLMHPLRPEGYLEFGSHWD